MNTKYRDWLFFAIVFFIPFIEIPYFLRMRLLGGPVGGAFVVFPLLIGMVYTIYCEWKYGNILVYKKQMVFFLLVSVVVAIAAEIHGALIYPYWEELLKQPDTNSRVFLLGKFLGKHGIVFSDDFIIKVMITWWSLKGAVLESLYTVGASYMIYCWYYSDYRQALKIMGKAIIYSLLFITMFSVVEIVAICGNQNADKMVLLGDALFHLPDPKAITGTGINRLVWIESWVKNGQVKSFFSEPSFLGLYLGFVISYLWYRILNKLCLKNVLLTLVASTLGFLTNARSAIALHVGMLVIMILLVLIKKKTELVKKVAVILLCSCIAFCVDSFFVKHVNVRVLQTSGSSQTTSGSSQTTSGSILQSNLLDIGKVESRSNRARFGYVVAAFNIGCKHPVLGVGRIFRAGYTSDNFPEWGLKSREVKVYIERQKKYGPLKHNIIVANQYIQVFAEQGILGLLLFLSPWVYVVWKLLKEYVKVNEKRLYEIVFLLILMAMQFASGVSCGFGLFFSPWLILALSYLVVFGEAETLINIDI